MATNYSRYKDDFEPVAEEEENLDDVKVSQETDESKDGDLQKSDDILQLQAGQEKSAETAHLEATRAKLSSAALLLKRFDFRYNEFPSDLSVHCHPFALPHVPGASTSNDAATAATASTTTAPAATTTTATT